MVGGLVYGWWLLVNNSYPTSGFIFITQTVHFGLEVFMKVVASCLLEILQLESCQEEAYNSLCSPICAHFPDIPDSKPTLHCRDILDPQKFDPALEFFMKVVKPCFSFPKTPRSPQMDHRVLSYGLTKEEMLKCIKIQELFIICNKSQ